MERLKDGVNDRRVGLVWTKTDIETPVPIPLKERVHEALTKHFKFNEIFSISVPHKLTNDNDIEEFTRVLNWVLEKDVPKPTPISLPILKPGEPIFAFRGKT
jgi:hypothetical protein